MGQVALAPAPKFCLACGQEVESFMPGGRVRSASLANLELVGMGFREDDKCPLCNSWGRFRLCLALLVRTPILEGVSRILHISPEHSLMQFFWKERRKRGFDYVCIDKFPRADYIRRCDICDLPFENGEFDLVLCSHVLEHVEDDSKAMREIFRVLCPGGKALLLVPGILGIDQTREDLTVVDPRERSIVYGQYNHVRLYALNDFEGRLLATGFAVDELRATQIVSAEEIDRFGLDPQESIWSCTKPGLVPKHFIPMTGVEDMNLVDLVIKVPEGTEEMVKERVMEIIKDCLIEQRRPETDAIDFEIDTDYALVREANGLAGPAGMGAR